jgi:hypothetical protein
MAITPRFVVGDIVQLRDVTPEAIGTVVALMRDGHVKVAWRTGQGYTGKTIMLSVRALRRWRDGASPEGGPPEPDTL